MKISLGFMLSVIGISIACAMYFAMKEDDTNTTLVIIKSKWMETPYSSVQMIDATKRSRFMINYIPPGGDWPGDTTAIPKQMWDTINIETGKTSQARIPNEFLKE